MPANTHEDRVAVVTGAARGDRPAVCQQLAAVADGIRRTAASSRSSAVTGVAEELFGGAEELPAVRGSTDQVVAEADRCRQRLDGCGAVERLATERGLEVAGHGPARSPSPSVSRPTPGENAVIPHSAGDVRAIRQIHLRIRSPIFLRRPPPHFGFSASNPRSSNAWITSRT